MSEGNSDGAKKRSDGSITLVLRHDAETDQKEYFLPKKARLALANARLVVKALAEMDATAASLVEPLASICQRVSSDGKFTPSKAQTPKEFIGNRGDDE